MVFLKTLFSSEESSEPLRKSIRRKYNRTFTRDPQDPNYYRQYLDEQCDVCMSMTTLTKEQSHYDYNETILLRATMPKQFMFWTCCFCVICVFYDMRLINAPNV